MIENPAEPQLNILQQRIRELMEQIDQLKLKLVVNYDITVPNKTTLATFYIINNNTNQKYMVAVGVSNTFFEERFDKNVGEKWAYEDGIKKAIDFLENFVFFKHFIESTSVTQEVSKIITS